MGIKDLLKFMKPYVEPIHIKKYAGKRVGIDAYSWLHKGAYSCSMELHLNMEGDKKKQYLSYCMHRINLLRHHNITPVVVFDGGNLPCKAATEEERHRKRKANRDLAMVKLKEGNVSAASELFQRAVSITPSMAHQLIQILRSENIEFVVAPYEADAQLAYLSHLEAEKGGIVAVISEDSDLLAYGCPSVVFKMDRFGNGEEIVLDKVFDSMARVPSFRNFDKELFIGMCVLAGCDFLPSVPGIGIGKAYSFVSKYRNIDRVLSVLKFEKGNQMPEDYLKCFKEAVAVFQHARIYDTVSKKLKHIKPLPHTLLQCLDEEIDFLGPEIPPSMAIAIAEGNLDPCTMEAFNCFPGTGSHLNPTTISQTHDRFPREEATALSTQQSCFTIVSSSKTRRERSPVIKQELISEERKQKPVLEERKYLNEAITLEKLVFPLKSEASQAIKTVPCKNTLTVPDNNPFKKRKFNEVQLDLTESTTKQVSAVTKVESLEIFCVTPESQQCMTESTTKQVSAVTKVESLEIFCVTPESQKCMTESITEQVSVVTEVESLEMFCVTPESQQSVDSKSIKMFDGKRRSKSENKLKRSNCDNSDNKKSSILNFFSRV